MQKITRRKSMKAGAGEGFGLSADATKMDLDGDGWETFGEIARFLGR